MIREPCESARTTSRNRIRIANTATPTIRVPFERLNENALRIVSRSSVPETIARPSAISSRISTSTLRSERRRQIAKAAISSRDDQAGRRIAVSSGGKRSACKITGSTAGRE